MRIIALSGLATIVRFLDFEGAGQIRTLQQPTDNGAIDLGCLTSPGKWTVDETRCDAFSGTREDNYTISLNTSIGFPLGIDNVDVAAREGLTAMTWMVSDGQDSNFARVGFLL